MEIEESHALSVDELLLSPFLQSVESKINCNEKNGVMMDMVPDVLRGQNEKAYSPTIISIGPLHKQTQLLQAMEPLKFSYTSALLERTQKFEETKRACASAMLKTAPYISGFYEPVKLQANVENDSRLAEVMLIDGCFIIELLYRNIYNNKDSDDDRILQNPFKYYAVQRDLLLLENQIPFSVLQELFDLTVREIPNEYLLKKNSKGKQPNVSLTEWVLSFFGNIMGIEKYEYMVSDTPYHMLHLLHMQYPPPPPPSTGIKKVHDNDREKVPGDDIEKREYDEIEKMENRINYSATELRLAGVELKAGKDRNLFHIKFTTAFSCTSCSTFFIKGHLEIPSFSISESTESFLRNFIALELSYSWIGNYFTSLAFLMDILIDTPEDVKLLEEAGIIRNNLGSRDEVVQLFNGICKNAIPRHFLYDEQYKKLMEFCHPWRVSTRRLKQYYFGNPWSGISVIAAIILFALTFLSTLYAMLSYYLN